MHHYTIRLLTCLGILIFALSLTGCRICNSNEDFDYPTYGGSWQRTLRDSGRVGSVFDPAGAKVASLSDRDSPNTEDEIERAKPENQDDRLDPDRGDGDDPDRDESDDPDSMDGPDQKSDGDEDSEDLKDLDLDDIESEDKDSFEDLDLDDIEVRIVPGKPPVMINTK